jgi:hypothetical protein
VIVQPEQTPITAKPLQDHWRDWLRRCCESGWTEAEARRLWPVECEYLLAQLRNMQK